MPAASSREREALEARCKPCPYCKGAGFVRVYSPTYRGHPLESVEAVVDGMHTRHFAAAAVNAHCLCPLGRWMRSLVRGDMLARTPDLADVLAGRSRWVHPDPHAED